MTAPAVRTAVDAALERLQSWLNGRQANVHSEISTTLVRAEPYDRSSSSYTIAESDVRTAVTELQRLKDQRDNAEYTAALAVLRSIPGDRFADLRAFCTTWLAELEQHGWLSRRLLLADGSELDVARLAMALDRLAELIQPAAQGTGGPGGDATGPRQLEHGQES